MAENTTQTDEIVADEIVADETVADETVTTTDDAQVEDNTASSEAASTEAAPTESVEAETEAPATETVEAAAPAAVVADEADSDSDDDNANQSQARPASSELSETLSPLGDVSEERKEVTDGRSYEIIYIVRPSGDDTLQNVTNRARKMIEDAEGAVDNVRVSESRRLAYPIDKEIEGSYVVINARFHKALLDELDRFLRLEDAVLRQMILREDDE